MGKYTMKYQSKAILLILGLCALQGAQSRFLAVEPDCAEYPISTNFACGEQNNNTYCPSGYCSKWGWCGKTDGHKKLGHKNVKYAFVNVPELCGGPDDSKKHEEEKQSEEEEKKNGPIDCDKYVFGQGGQCGKKNGNTYCSQGWCSKWGWCGFSDSHKNGQKDFGVDQVPVQCGGEKGKKEEEKKDEEKKDEEKKDEENGDDDDEDCEEDDGTDDEEKKDDE